MRSAISFLILALGLMLLVAAFGSDEVSSKPEQDPETLDTAPAQFLVQEALFRVRARDNETGEYTYLLEEIGLVEQVIKKGPGNLELTEVMSWVYGTYPAYVDDSASHKFALESGLELFRVRCCCH